jgi:predicted transcriptional regulator
MEYSMTDAEKPDLTTLTVQLLSAYVGNNSVAAEALPDLIAKTRHALSGETAPVVASAPDPAPAVSVRKSLASPEHILSMIDGKPYKTLKRHIGMHGMTPAEYRSRYGLPKDYPMVAPAYSEQRRATAARIGLGRKGRSSAESIQSEQVVSDPTPAPEPSPQPDTIAASADLAAPAEGTTTPAVKPRRGKLSIASAQSQPKDTSVQKPRAVKSPKAKPATPQDATEVAASKIASVPADETPLTPAAKRPRTKRDKPSAPIDAAPVDNGAAPAKRIGRLRKP